MLLGKKEGDIAVAFRRGLPVFKLGILSFFTAVLILRPKVVIVS